MSIINKERVLYDFYGEDHKIKIPELAKSSKAIERHIFTNYEREMAKAKVFAKTHKDLFLKARWKLTEDLKRTLSSASFEYKYKIKVLKGQLNNITKISTLKGLIDFELKKLKMKQKNSVKYVNSAHKWIQNTDDTPESKIKSFNKIKENELIAEEVILNIMQMLSAIKVLLSKGCSINEHAQIIDENGMAIDTQHSISKLFSSTPLEEFVKNISIDEFKKLWNSLVDKTKIFDDDRKKYAATIQEDIKSVKKDALNAKRAIKQDFRSRILKAEYEYNKEFVENKEKALLSKKQALASISNKKEVRLEKVQEVTDAINTYKTTKKFETKILKIHAKQKCIQKYFMYIFDLYNKIYENAKKVIPTDLVSSFEQANSHFKTTSNNYAEVKEQSLVVKHSNGKKDEYHVQLQNSIKELKESKNHVIQSLNAIQNSINSRRKESKNSKINFSLHFGKYGEFEYKRMLKQKSKAESYIDVAHSMKNYTYAGDFLYKNSVHKINWINSWLLELDLLNKERRDFLLSLSSDNVSGSENFKNDFISKKIEIKNSYNTQINKLHNDVKNKDITKKALTQKKMESKIYRREAINELKLSNPEKKAKGIVSSFKWRYLGKKRIWRKVYESKVSETRKITPVEVKKGTRFIAFAMGLVAPGLAEITLFKQYAKGILMLAVTMFMWFFMFPFIMGWTTGKMGGIFGLGDMGASQHDWALGLTPDARYYLLGGVISIILLIGMVVYFLSSAIASYRIGLVMEHGARSVGWIQTKSWLGNRGFPWLIALPGWILILIIVVTPIITSVLVSFTNMGFNHEPPGKTVDWVGLNQYGKWWLFKDAGMGKSIGRVLQWTLIWTFLSAGLVIVLGTLVAVLVNQEKVKFKKLWRLIYVIPWAIPAFVTIMFLKSAFQASGDSLINLIFLKIGFIDEPINWWTSIWTIRIILILLQGWLGHAYIFLLITGNMQSIPKDIYEAGSIDGAKGNQLFRYMTMPLLLRTIAPLLIAQFTFSFNNFTIISLFSGGGPQYLDPTPFLEGGTDILISWVYKLTTGVAQIDGNLGFSAAMSILASLMAISFASYGFAKSAAFKGA